MDVSRQELDEALRADTAYEAPEARQAVQNEPDVEAAILRRLTFGLGVPAESATLADWFQAAALTARESLVGRWHETNRRVEELDLKQVSYLSMEFLLSRELENTLIALGRLGAYREALARHGVSLADVLAEESDPALGNGGLGRLAACFLDSTACIGVPCVGYGIRYEFGMFRQSIVDGWQVEQPDDWLAVPNPWEFARPERTYRVRFGGRVEHHGSMAHWVDSEDVFATAYDMLVPGQGCRAVNTLRLWSAKPVDVIDLSAFNRGAFVEALEHKVRSKSVARVLYPDDSTEEGRELRLRQEHFFVSASMQDIIARFLAGRPQGEDCWDALPDKVAVHLNDTHPALAPAELMRILVDEHKVKWERAWRLTRETFSYTNHTLMPEALEVWPRDMLQRLLPRHYEIIAEVNRRFLETVSAREGPDPEIAQRVEIVHGHDGGVNMGRFSVVASRRVNGVSRLHSALMREQLFSDYARLYPERFESVTNGITPRRWLFQANPKLSALIDAVLGPGWRGQLERLEGLAAFAGEPALREGVAHVKRANKARLGDWLKRELGVTLNPDAMLDVQIKRVHEYKRQLLNIIGTIAHWNAIRAAPDADWPARTVVIAGKAASAYWMAKLIIKLAHDVARKINSDPVMRDRLKLVFLPNYGVSLAELVIPAADLSQQISLAGTEASGTSNMKLAMNGALTLATEDGANIEIAEGVGRDNIFMFGLKVADVATLRSSGYAAREIYEADPALRRAIDQIASGEFSPDEPDRFRPIVDSLLEHNDPFFVLGDFAAYRAARQEVDRQWGDQDGWSEKAIRNIAGVGRFTSDRAVREYAERIWQAATLPG